MIEHYFRLLRFGEWLPRFSILVVGYILAGNIGLNSINVILIALLSFVGVAASGFIINDYFDREFDKKKTKNRNPISNNLVSKNSAIILALIFALSGLAVSYFLVPHVFFLFLLSFILLAIYSAPPFRLKEKLALDVIVNAFAMPLLFLIGYTLVKEINFSILFLAFAIFLLDITTGLLQEIRDFSADKKAGLSTTVIRFGIDKSVAVIRLILISFIALYFFTIYLYFPLYFLLLLISLIPMTKFVFFEDLVKEISYHKLNSIANKSHLILIIMLITIISLWLGVVR